MEVNNPFRHHHCKCSIDGCWVPGHFLQDYATARSILVNIRSARKQLSQAMMPVFCDEGVLHTVADILMSQSDDTFADIYGMFGGFHYARILLSGSGLDDALVEAEVSGKRTLIDSKHAGDCRGD